MFCLFAYSQQVCPSITIVNNTGYTMNQAYVGCVASDSWGEELLNDKALSSGESFTVSLSVSLDVANRYDIKLVDSDGDTYIKWDEPIAEASKIVFTMDDFVEKTQPSGSFFDIVNNTGHTIYYAYASQSTSDNWEDDVLEDDVLHDGESFTVRPLASLDIAVQYDFMLLDGNGEAYMKWNVPITEESKIVFTIDDFGATKRQTSSSYVNLSNISIDDLSLFKIINNTEKTVYYVYVSPVTSDSWGDDVLDEEVLYDGDSFAVILWEPLEVVNRYDIMLVDLDGYTYTKMNVEIEEDVEIIFTIEDLD